VIAMTTLPLNTKLKRKSAFWNRLVADRSGLALTEFAFAAPIMISMLAGGVELSNYALVQTAITQVGLQLASNGSRIGDDNDGNGNFDKKYQINESHVNDIFDGAAMHAGEMLDLYGTHKEDDTIVGNGKVVLSNVVPILVNGAASGNYRISWQRCRGESDYLPAYGRFGEDSGNLLVGGIGPEGRKAYPSGTNNQLTFVEVQYRYQPIFLDEKMVKDYSDIKTTAAFIVNDERLRDDPAPNAAPRVEDCDADGA
jgi:hypothetical protein